MKAAIGFIEPDNKLAILTKLLDIIQGIDQLRQHVLTHGILLENLTPRELEALKEALRKLDYSDYTATENSLRLKIAGGDLSNLIRLVITIPGFGNDFAEMFWERGFSIENLPPDQADDLKRRLEPIAIVTITPDIADIPEPVVYTVSGQVRRQDGIPFTESGFTVHALDSVSPNNLVPLGSVALSPQASYHLSYSWRSDGRSGPNLVVRLVSPQGETVAEVRASLAPAQAVLNITVKNQQPQSFVLTAHVKNQATGEVVPNVQVEAQFRANNSTLRTISGTTNAEGVALIPFDETVFKDIPNGQNVEVSFGVHREEQALETNTTIPNLQSKNQELEILVSVPESGEERFVVNGTVRQADETSLPDVIVRAFDRDMRAEKLLGEGVTNAQGFYEIHYNREKFRKEEEQADLTLKLFSIGGDPIASVRLTSDSEDVFRSFISKTPDGQTLEYQVWFNAPTKAVINVTVNDARYRGLPEFDRYLQELNPLLEDISHGDLTEADIAFLAAETKIDAQHILYLKTAENLLTKTRIGARAYYGLFRQNLPTDLTYLLAKEPNEWRLALQQSGNDNIIQPYSESELNAVIAQIKELIPQLSAGIVPDVAESPLTNLLTIAAPDPELRLRFATEYANYDGKDPEAFWTGLKSKPGFQDDVVNTIQFTFQASTLTGNNLPLVQALDKTRKDGKISTVKDLAGWEEEDWLSLFKIPSENGSITIPEDIPGATVVEKEWNYSQLLVRLVEATFPTAAITARIEKDAFPGKNDLLTFLQRNPDFAFERTPYRRYVQERGNIVLEGVKNPESIAAAQRVFNIAPQHHLMKPLLENQLDSALAVYRLGASQFIGTYAGTLGSVRQAQLIYQQAEVQTAQGMAWLSANNSAFDLYRPWVVPAQSALIRQLLLLLPNGQDSGQDQITIPPDLKLLFGSLTSCECQHCRSIYSPAAYLVDALNLLKRGGEDLFDGLEHRRPDISAIELTCANTNTLLLFIDLVNEVLERAIASNSSSWQLPSSPPLLDALNRKQIPADSESLRVITPPLSKTATVSTVEKRSNHWVIHDANRVLTIDLTGSTLEVNAYPQTTWTAEELVANPEHTIDAAYLRLSESVYPSSLPFDLFLETSRIYLKHFGTSRHEVMALFQKRENPSDDQIAWEALGLSPAERGIIVGMPAAGDSSLGRFYGYSSAIAESAIVGNLSPVPEFLYRSGIEYEDLLKVIDTRFVNRGGVVALTAPPDADCNLDKYGLDGITIEFLDRLHRFIRLQRRLGWSIAELDRAVEGVGEADPANPPQKLINNALLVKLAHLQELLSKSSLPIDEWLSLWTSINTRGVNSLYLRLFQNKKITNPVADRFALRSDLADLQIVPGGASPTLPAIIDADIPVIQAGLRIGSADLESLKKRAIDDGTLTLSNLTRLYRHALLARLLKVRISELLSLRQLIQHDPFIDPLQTSLFIKEVNQLKSSRFKLVQLEYLYLGDTDAAAVLDPDEEQIWAIVRALVAGLQTRPSTDDLPVLSNEDQLRNELTAELNLEKLQRIPDLSPVQIDAALNLLRTNWTGKPDSDRGNARQQFRQFFGSFLSIDDAALTQVLDNPDANFKAAQVLEPLKTHHLRRSLTVELAEFLQGDTVIQDALNFLISPQEDTTENLARITSLFGKFLEPVEARAHLLGSALSGSDKLVYVLQQLFFYRTRRDFVVQTLAVALKLESGIMRLLLEELVNLPETTEAAMRTFLNLGSSNIAIANLQEIPATVRQAYLQLNEIAILVNGFELSAEELGYFASSGRFELDNLQFNQWNELLQYQQLRESLPSRKTRLIDVFRFSPEEGGTLVEARQQLEELLAAATGWDPAAFAELTTLDDLRNSATLSALQQKIAISRRTGISLDRLQAWVSQAPTAEQVQQIRQTVKAKYDDKRWLEVVRPLEDILREKRRDALVAYLVRRPEEWLSPQKIEEMRRLGRRPEASLLYEHFLIDVEMSSCQLTSRIRQAIAAVQLFIQRCMIGLEGSSEIPVSLAQEWESWMKTYRYWEANRKVFVYPENWIEPTLRDDKTPFFKVMENSLLQNDVTQPIVEDAFLQYLDQLNDVAKLEVVGMYVQKEAGTDAEAGVDILHVFGRTSGTPHRYYYRRRIDSRYWTEWEKVELDIEGDHLIPVVWNRRLYLVWPIFSEKAEQDQVPAEPDNDPDCLSGEPVEKTDDARAERCRQRARERDQRNAEKTPMRYWEIKLAYTEYNNSRWSAKITSIASLNTLRSKEYRRSSQPNDFNFRASINGTLDIVWYIDQISEGRFIFSKCDCNPTAQYESDRLFTFHPFDLKNDAMQFVELNSFENNALKLFDSGVPSVPHRTSTDIMERRDLWDATELATKVTITALNTTPTGTYRVLPSSQQLEFNAANLPFFYQDANRVFFVNKEVPPPQEEAADQLYPWIYYTPPINWAIMSNYWSVKTGYQNFKWSTTVPNAIAVAADTVAPVTNQSQPLHITIDWFVYSMLGEEWKKRYVFRSFSHPYACFFINQLNRYGIKGLLDPSSEGEARKLRRQQLDRKFFDSEYDPNRDVVAPEYLDPAEEIDFDFDGSYSQYNWEIFFHGPLLVAERLTQNQQFALAQKWMHYIFDPTVGKDDTVTEPDPARFWKIRPFYEAASDRRTPDEMMRALNQGDPKLKDQVDQWRKDPFNPHLIARLRITAYMKATVMKYLDNLLAWGDYLFRQDTLETLAEATQLYVLSANILGPRPPIIPARGEPSAKTFQELEPILDDFGNALIKIEEQISAFRGFSDRNTSGLPSILYFCIPPNDKLLAYWDTVSDRLFKIRHCMNIEGIVRQLPLFEPPIDPAMLVRARAQGVDLRDVLAGGISISPYRYNIILQKANELCADVRALGSALLSAYEKRDAEELSRLRSNHEIRLLDAMKEVRQKQIDEALEQKNALEKTREQVMHRRNFYRDIDFMNESESLSMALGTASSMLSLVANGLSAGGAAAALVPEITIGISGWAGSPVTITTTGGQQASNVSKSWGQAFEFLAGYTNMLASLSGTLGNHRRRWDDWKLQEQLADKELLQIDKQIGAADIRWQIAQKELENHEVQRKNAQEVLDHLRDKFTSQELYTWMVSEISTIYFQSYQLAYEAARRAENAYRFEMGVTDSTFIRYGQWDSLRRGLMAGERLQFDLRKLEMSYLNENAREYELTKHLSLLSMTPVALIALKETGQCEIALPEVLFDVDYPGHYMRRIKNVSISIPCVTGPYTSVNCTLTLLSNKIRKDNSNPDAYLENIEGDSRFLNDFAPMQSIATSSGQADSGLFELNFRDERYLPFEGAGAISRWRLELSGKWDLPEKKVEFQQFDFHTISDVVLHMRYTARDGGTLLKQAAVASLDQLLTSPDDNQMHVRLFSLRNEFASEWHQLLNSQSIVMRLGLNRERFPLLFRGKDIIVKRLEFYLQIKQGKIYPGGDAEELSISSVKKPDGTTIFEEGEAQLGIKGDASPIRGMPYAEIKEIDVEIDEAPWEISISNMTKDMANNIADLFIVCHYSARK